MTQPPLLRFGNSVWINSHTDDSQVDEILFGTCGDQVRTYQVPLRTMTDSSSQPLVSCVMPTTARRRLFIPQAINYFQRQDYVNKELLVVDDGPESIADLIPTDPSVRYIRLAGRRSLGQKRNECVKAAAGDLIMHWDDDDWMAPHRISQQVEALHSERALVCGLQRMLFYDFTTGAVWLYEYPNNHRRWVAGGSLLYRREFWQRSPFPNVQVGSDTRFIWGQATTELAVMPDYSFYVALVHSGNTSQKDPKGSYWKNWTGDLRDILGEDLPFYESLNRPAGKTAPAAPRATTVAAIPRSAQAIVPSRTKEGVMSEVTPTYSIIMVVHNTCDITKLATLRTLRHSAGHDARLVVVDNASSDGTERWLALLAQRGDIDLIRCETNRGHGPALELARAQTKSPYIVALDSDAFPLVDHWLPQLRGRLNEQTKVSGIRHHRDYIHPACLMVARETLDKMGLTFLNEKDRPSQFDVGERISYEVKRAGHQIAGLERTNSLRRGSVSEPVYLGSEYEGLVYHQWYTTRRVISHGGQVDDVASDDLNDSLRALLQRAEAEPREITVVMGIRAAADEPERVRNAEICLQALNLQDIARWRYRLVVVEQDSAPRLESLLTPIVDQYIFAYNPGPYNRGWPFNIGACLPGSQSGVLCLIDADLLAPREFLRHALETIQGGTRAALPYDRVVYLDAAATDRVVEDYVRAPESSLTANNHRGRVFSTSQGGCIWIEASLYREIGGHDERFRGWGREDREFCNRLARFTSIKRLSRPLVHLYHPRPKEEDEWATANERLFDQIAASATSRPPEPIGNLQRYQNETTAKPAGGPSQYPRSWENWNKWTSLRIEKIVSDERRRSPHTSHRWNLAQILMQLGNSLLDVGCGPGPLWPHLDAHSERFSWIGVDVTESMMAAAHRMFPRVPLLVADAGGLPFADQSVDVVLLRHVLEHLPQGLMERALSESMRIARRAVVLDFYLPPQVGNCRDMHRIGEGFLETRWTRADVEVPISQAGWRVDRLLTLKAASGEADAIWILSSVKDPSNSDLVHKPEPFKISIVMPTYRRSHTLLRTVQMVQAQTYRNWQLIIIDNGNEAEYEFNDPRIQIYGHSERLGASYARNQGLRYADGDLVCFFDDDDDMFPEYLESFAEAFSKHPHAKMIRCGMIVSDKRINFTYATPECCLRRDFATPTWPSLGPAHDQYYFRKIIDAHGWSELKGDIVTIREALCRANSDSKGGLRSGRL